MAAAGPAGFELHALRRFAGTAWSTSQRRSARGSAGPASAGYTGFSSSLPGSALAVLVALAEAATGAGAASDLASALFFEQPEAARSARPAAIVRSRVTGA